MILKSAPKLLLVRPDKIGDVVLTTPAVAAIRVPRREKTASALGVVVVPGNARVSGRVLSSERT